MKSLVKIVALILFSVTCASAQTKKVKVKVKNSVSKSSITSDGVFAEFDTNKGKIVIQLDYKQAPITVANFVSLAEGTNKFVSTEFKGKPFYNGLKFHRVIPGFMIQGGCPLRNGTGNPGYKFKDEIDPTTEINKRAYKRGVLAMANSGPNTNGSQFFIMHKDYGLPLNYSIFGSVVSGIEFVDVIVNTPRNNQDLPNEDQLINKITIIKNGAEAKAFDAAKIFTNYFANKTDDDKKQAVLEADKRAKQMAADAEKMKVYNAKYAPVKLAKIASLNAVKATTTKTPSGLQYKITQKGSDKKPVDGTDIYVHYAGYFEDGTLFDSSYEAINKDYGKFDENRAKANGYSPFPFKYGNKSGLIPGFLEGINLMNLGDKAVFFIPANLGYGEKGANGVIPPNSNLIFELEILGSLPEKK